MPPGELRRRLQGTFLLGRACGVRSGATLEILDATAGLGTDGLALALAGQRVTLVERERPLWAMIHDLRRRLQPPGGLHPATSIVLGDCAAVIGDGAGPVADVVYFDPMFPVRGKTALPGKRMQYLAELLAGSAEIAADLVEHARSRVRSRVVVKRRRRDPSFGKPDWAITGRSVRYDVYSSRRMA